MGKKWVSNNRFHTCQQKVLFFRTKKRKKSEVTFCFFDRKVSKSCPKCTILHHFCPNFCRNRSYMVFISHFLTNLDPVRHFLVPFWYPTNFLGYLTDFSEPLTFFLVDLGVLKIVFPSSRPTEISILLCMSRAAQLWQSAVPPALLITCSGCTWWICLLCYSKPTDIILVIPLEAPLYFFIIVLFWTGKMEAETVRFLT